MFRKKFFSYFLVFVLIVTSFGFSSSIDAITITDDDWVQFPDVTGTAIYAVVEDPSTNNVYVGRTFTNIDGVDANNIAVCRQSGDRGRQHVRNGSTGNVVQNYRLTDSIRDRRKVLIHSFLSRLVVIRNHEQIGVDTGVADR